MELRLIFEALVVNTGEFTGRPPKDRFIVKDEIIKNKIWWGYINLPFNTNNFDIFENIANEEIKRGGPQRFFNKVFDFN